MTEWQTLEDTPEMRDMIYALERVLVAIPYQKASKPGETFWQIDTISLDDETGEICEDTGWALEDYTHWAMLPTPPLTAEEK